MGSSPQPGPDLSPEALRGIFATAFGEAPIGMAVVGLDGRMLVVNRALCDLLGHTEDELRGRDLRDLSHPDDIAADEQLLQETIGGHRRRYEIEKRYRRADGGSIWALLSASLVSDAEGRPLHLISHVQDVTGRHELELRLQHLADRDPLTGLLNRRRFEEDLAVQAARCTRYGEQASIAMIDLDGFKAINDTHGHAAGDEVLRAVSTALSGRMRLSDTLARVGGDEFAAILIGVEEGGAARVASALSLAVAQAGTVRPVRASVGVAQLRTGDTVDGALARADAAMYAVKRARSGT